MLSFNSCTNVNSAKRDALGPSSLQRSVQKYLCVYSLSCSKFQGNQDALSPNTLRRSVRKVSFFGSLHCNYVIMVIIGQTTHLADKMLCLTFIKYQAEQDQDALGPKSLRSSVKELVLATKRQISAQLAPNFVLNFFLQCFFERGGPSKHIPIANFAVVSMA